MATQTYTVLHVLTKTPDLGETGLDDLQRELERYLYGRSFLLAREADGLRPLTSWLWLVETHYVQSIIPRLASGLYGARVATAEEQDRVGL